MVSQPYDPDDRHYNGPIHSSRGGPMILIVDDEVEFGNSLAKFFQYSGLEASAVASGMEALTYIHVRKPKLIILDLHMPTLDGMTMLRAIRKDPDFAAVPIVIYSSDFTWETQRAALAAGAAAYLVKGTLGLDALLDRVMQLLGEGGSRLRLAD